MRNRIAGYLHDHVAQDLSSLKIGLETLFDHQGEVPAEMGAKICELSKILQDSIAAVRDLSYDLHPSIMEERVSLLEGTLSIKSQPSKGTRILVEVPCKEKTDD